MRVLITGVAGLIGNNLARAYLNKGWEVFGVDDLSVGTGKWLPKGIEFYCFDVCDKSQPVMIVCDLVIHLASRKIPRNGDSQKTLIENTIGIRNICQYASNAGAKLIYLSTSDVYGKNPDCREESHLSMGPPDVMRWSYAISKMWGEQLLYSTPEDFNFNIVRLFNSFGPYYALSWTAGPQSVFISQALKKEPMTIHGDGSQKRCYQYVDDAVDGIMRLAESDCMREVFNIGNPNESVSVDDMSRMIWKMINPGTLRPAKNIPHSAYKYEEIPERIPNISKARNMLGFEPKISFEEGLRRTIEWQRTVI